MDYHDILSALISNQDGKILKIFDLVSGYFNLLFMHFKLTYIY